MANAFLVLPPTMLYLIVEIKYPNSYLSTLIVIGSSLYTAEVFKWRPACQIWSARRREMTGEHTKNLSLLYTKYFLMSCFQPIFFLLLMNYISRDNIFA